MPQKLSDTNAFSDLGSLTVTDGFLPYDMIDPFWSDGAYKKRWMAIPNDGTHDTPGERIKFSEDGVWEFPVGSVIIKHFDYPVDENDPTVTRKVETRFSIKKSDGGFYYLTYKWRADQSDADLIDMATGDNAAITVATVGGGSRTVDWRYPSTNECLNCHNEASQGTLGPRTRYLNSDYDYSSHTSTGQTGNQLVTLSYLGILDTDINDTDTPGFLTHTSIDDTSASIEDRARSYLDLNCAYCHRPANGLRPNFDLRLINTLEETGLLTAGINEPIEAMGDGQRILDPGNAERSQLYHRVNSTTPGIMMPPLAKGRVDERGVALLKEWIDGMNTPPTAVASSDRTTGNAPLNIVFTGSGSTDDRGMASYAWDFGDGATSTLADPSHLYTAPGKYTATLTVTDLDGLTSTTSIDILVTGGETDNAPDADVNLALLPDAVLSGTVTGGRGTPRTILYDPSKEGYFIPTPYNEYGVLYKENLGRPGADEGFKWQVDWESPKLVNYITFGGTYPNQPQPNTLWRVSYLRNGNWTVIEQGRGGWIDRGIYEWGGASQPPVEAEALRVQLYSDGNSDLVSIHIRGRGGLSRYNDDRSTTTKATLIQYLPGGGYADTVAPTIVLNGGSTIDVALGGTYVEPGATAQ
ncbi:MAG: PKD domain-containing protein, partial [Ornithinimicrobium sp.]